MSFVIANARAMRTVWQLTFSLSSLVVVVATVFCLQLTHVSPVTIGVMYGTGVLMSLSPCALSLLPLTVSYIAGTEAEGAAEEAAAGGEKGGFDAVRAGFVPSAAFAAGKAYTLSILQQQKWRNFYFGGVIL